MTKRKLAGYIVCSSDEHDALLLCGPGEFPGAPVLLLHDDHSVTIFLTYAAARKAILRNRRYARARRLPWGNYYTKRVYLD